MQTSDIEINHIYRAHVATVKKLNRQALATPIAYLALLSVTILLESIYVWPAIAMHIKH